MPWEGVYIDILKGEQFAPEYVKLNPKAVVPTLVHDDLVIVDGTVIIEYLDDLAPGNSVHPTDPYERTQARLWIKRWTKTCTRRAGLSPSVRIGTRCSRTSARRA